MHHRLRMTITAGWPDGLNKSTRVSAFVLMSLGPSVYVQQSLMQTRTVRVCV